MATAKLKRRANSPDTPRLFAAYRNSGSSIRKILRRHPLSHKRTFALRTSISTYAGHNTPTVLALDQETASSPPKMDDVTENLEAFAISAGEANTEGSPLVAERAEVRANYPKESPIATCDTETTTLTLMILPFEIRSAVLREVLGDRYVHTHFDQNYRSDPESPLQRPRFTFCCDEFYEDMDRMNKREARAEVNPERYSGHPSYLQRHFYCGEGEDPVVDIRDRPDIETERSDHALLRERNLTQVPYDEFWVAIDPDAFDARLSVLAVCRQLRREGLRALYSSNSFPFVDSYSFNAFVKQLTLEKASLIRKIELSLTFECDLIEDNDVFEKDGPQNMRSDWTVGGPGPRYENMWAALDGLTDVTIWVCDKVPIAHHPRCEWKKARKARTKRISLWLRSVFGDLRDLRKVRKAKVLVSWKSKYEGLNTTGEQIRYEADKEVLQSIGDEFAKEILGTTSDRHIA